MRARLGINDCDTVSVRIDSAGRDLVFGDVTVRTSPDFRLELHLDTDEANAAGVSTGDLAELIASLGSSPELLGSATNRREPAPRSRSLPRPCPAEYFHVSHS